jgi:hypothetical protein
VLATVFDDLLVRPGHPSMGPFYIGLGVIVVALCVGLLVRLSARHRAKEREKAAAWEAFRRLVKSRGYSGAQASVLALIARRARLQRPTQVVTSIHVFDRCVVRAQTAGALTNMQEDLLEGIRRKLVSVPTPRERGIEQRNLERVALALRIGFVHVSRGEAEQAIASANEPMDDAHLKPCLIRLTADLEPIGAQAINLSAGGLAMMAGNTVGVEEGDYLGLSCDPATMPVDLNGIYGQVRSVSDLPEQAAVILHVSFLPYTPEQKRQVIQLVYRQQESTAAAPRPGRRPGAPPERPQNKPDGGEVAAE